MTWLEMSINSVKEAVKLMNIPKPARLYLPVLPYIIEDDEAFAVFDNPYMQTYEKVVFEAEKMGHTLIAGRSGSGKSEMIHTILEQIPEDVSVYIIDHGGGRLKDQSIKRCCGGYIPEEDTDDIDRLMIFIEELLTARRMNKDAENEPGSRVMLVLDGFDSIEKSSDDFRERIIRILTSGKTVNITVIASSCEVPAGKASRLFDTYLFLGDEDPYTISQYLKASPRDIPQVMYIPGRGIGVREGVPLEFQAVKTGEHLGKSPPQEVSAAKFPHVPKRATLDDLITSANNRLCGSCSTIPVGYEKRSGKIYGFPAKDLNCVLIYGRAYSGRHTLLFNISITAARYGIPCIYVQSYEALISALRATEEKLIVTVESITKILDDFYDKARSEDEEEELAGYLSNHFAANSKAEEEKLIVGIIDNEAKMRFAGRRVFEDMCRHIYGITLGGKLDENRVFDYSYLTYSQMQKSQSRGYATVVKFDENHFFGDVIFPVEI